MSPAKLATLPARAQTWLTYDRSITEAASVLTGVQACVSSLSQQAQYAPLWLPAPYRSDEQTYARQIELMSGACRVLIAVSYTRPDSDLAERLEVLDRAPLANLLFQTGSAQNPTKTYVQTGFWCGRLVEWQVAGCDTPLILLELFDPDFVKRYTPPTTTGSAEPEM